VLKKKGKTPDSFYVANDQLQIVGHRVRLPKIGWGRLREPLWLSCKFLGACVVQEGDQWFLAVSVPDAASYCSRSGNGTEGADVGVTTFATLSTVEKIYGPNALHQTLRRVKIRQRSDFARSPLQRHSITTQSQWGQSESLYSPDPSSHRQHSPRVFA
jgi:putative transposase